MSRLSLRRIREVGTIPRKVVQHLQSRRFLDMIGSTIAEDIVKKARAGYGAEEDNTKEKRFAPLAASTIKRRKRLKDIGRLSNLTKPSKSNLTETEHMLDNVSYSTKLSGVRIFVKNDVQNGVSAKQKAKYAHRETRYRPKRPFMFVSRTNMRKALRLMEEARDEYIRSLL